LQCLPNLPAFHKLRLIHTRSMPSGMLWCCSSPRGATLAAGFRRKGNLFVGIPPHEAAAQEAFEEAGIIGQISPVPLESYEAVKSRAGGMTRSVSVTLYPMRVEARADQWPEEGQGSALWFELIGAARVVREHDLSRLVERFNSENHISSRSNAPRESGPDGR